MLSVQSRLAYKFGILAMIYVCCLNQKLKQSTYLHISRHRFNNVFVTSVSHFCITFFYYWFIFVAHGEEIELKL